MKCGFFHSSKKVVRYRFFSKEIFQENSILQAQMFNHRGHFVYLELNYTLEFSQYFEISFTFININIYI